MIIIYHIILWYKRRFAQNVENVQRIMNDRNMTVYRLARETKINENTLYSYSRGVSEPSFKNMCKVADALNVSLDKFREDQHG